MTTKLDKSNNFIISLDSFLSHLDLNKKIIKNNELDVFQTTKRIKRCTQQLLK